MTIMLADKTLRIPMGVVENATVTIGNNDFPIDFLVVDMPTDTLCPIVFRRNFLNDIGAKVDFRQEIVSLKLGDYLIEFANIERLGNSVYEVKEA